MPVLFINTSPLSPSPNSPLQSFRFSRIYLYLFCLTYLFLSACRSPKDLSFVRVVDWKTTEVGISNSKISAQLLCRNPNPYRLTLQNLDARVSLDGRFLGTLSIDQPIAIPAATEFTLPIQFQVSMTGFYASGVSILLGSELPVTVEGMAKGKRSIFTRTLPVKYSGRHRLSDFKL
jgi:LEA14-like dessication related protein